MEARRWIAPVVLALFAALSACGGGDEKAPSGSKTAPSAPPPSVKVAPPAGDGAPVEAGAPASIHGVVHFAGTPPERKPLAIGNTAGCCPQSPPRFTEAVIVEGGKLVNVIVSISRGLGSSYEAPPPPEEPHRMTQECCVYAPHVSAVRAGQRILVSNDDDTSHNVHVYAKRTNVPNRTQGAGAAPLEIVFEKAEAPVRVGCDIHPWMTAWVGVFDHPFFDVTGEDGAFELTGLPPGKYTLSAWHEQYGRKTVDLELPAGGAAEVDFTYAAK